MRRAAVVRVRTIVLLVTLVGVLSVMTLSASLLVGCTAEDETSSTEASEDADAGGRGGGPSGADIGNVRTISKAVAPGGEVTLGGLDSDGFTLVLAADAYAGVADVAAAYVPSAQAPAMENAHILGDGYAVDAGGVGRLDGGATLTYRYDPAVTPDPMLLALAYHDGTSWTYSPAESVDTATSTVTFSVYHFSAYFPAEFKNELEAARSFASQMAARQVLGEGGGDSKTASAALAGLLASKLGLGEDKFSKKMLEDIAADQSVIKLIDELQKEGWTDTGYTEVMKKVCSRVADYLVKNREALGAGDVAGLTNTEIALKNMGLILKVGGQEGARFFGYVVEGDMDSAGRELFEIATDNTGVAGKALKYTLKGMQNALDVWRDGEVEKAFQVYVNGSDGNWFGYGAVDAGNFDEVWDNMRGAARQLHVERIALENDARSIAGMPPLSAVEEEFYREKVKRELKREFDRRIALEERIEAQKRNLDRIFVELHAAKMFDGTNVWIRSLNDPLETLESRLNRFERLINRIMNDLEVHTVYEGPQHEGTLGGRISAMSMAQMLRGYFSAETLAEGEAALQEFYERWITIDLNGLWTGNLTITNIELSPELKAELERLAQNPPPGDAEGCSGFEFDLSGLTSFDEILQQFIGHVCPLTMDITANQGGTGSVRYSIDLSALGATSGVQEFQAPLSWTGNSLNFSSVLDDQTATFSGKAVKIGGRYALNGTMTSVAKSDGVTVYTMSAKWSATKQ